MLNGPENFLLAKFELRYKKYAEFYADSKSTEKKCDKLVAKKLQTKIVERLKVFVPF